MCRLSDRCALCHWRYPNRVAVVGSVHFTELLKVDQPMMALEVLHDVLTSRRHRTWSPVHEQIMFKYIDLCIQLQA